MDEELVTDDLELATLGLSSLEVMEMVYDAEDELDIVVDEDSLGDVTTVGGLVVVARWPTTTSQAVGDEPEPPGHDGRRTSSALARAARAATEFGAKSVYRFLDSGADWSFATLERRARCVAAQLGAVEPGERVGILAEDRAVFCDAFFGAHARGVVPVPLGIAGTVGSDAWRAVRARPRRAVRAHRGADRARRGRRPRRGTRADAGGRGRRRPR